MATDLHRDSDTIAAIATPYGPGGVGIVKISGPRSRYIFNAIFKPAKEIDQPKSHHLYYGWVKDPTSGQLVDEVLCTLMAGPHSYTREDVLEIHCHSGPALLTKILQLVLALGARPAMPGEFTKRAFLNGRIDLAQAEAILALTTTKGDAAAAAAASQLNGVLSQEIRSVKEKLLEALAAVEVAIDYPEEEEEILSEAHILEKLYTHALPLLEDVTSAYDRSRIWREGATVLIVGRPNVGKSSLLNALICRDRAIVSPIPGTTRDVIEAEVSIEGIAVKLIDTAGIRHSPDPIEALGIEKVGAMAERASLALWVLDASDLSGEDDEAVLSEIGPIAKDETLLVILNKIDLVESTKLDQLYDVVRGQTSSRPGLKAPCCIPVSAKMGHGLTELTKAIAQRLLSSDQGEPPEIMPSLRQKVCAQKAQKALNQAISNLKASASPEIVAIDLRDAISCLDEITGESASEDLLDQIFSNFCLGK